MTSIRRRRGRQRPPRKCKCGWIRCRRHNRYQRWTERRYRWQVDRMVYWPSAHGGNTSEVLLPFHRSRRCEKRHLRLRYLHLLHCLRCRRRSRSERKRLPCRGDALLLSYRHCHSKLRRPGSGSKLLLLLHLLRYHCLRHLLICRHRAVSRCE